MYLLNWVMFGNFVAFTDRSWSSSNCFLYLMSITSHLYFFLSRDASGKVELVKADLNLDNKDFKKTAKVTWLADTDECPLTPAVCVHFDHIITKGVLGKDENFKDFVNYDSKASYVVNPKAQNYIWYLPNIK